MKKLAFFKPGRNLQSLNTHQKLFALENANTVNASQDLCTAHKILYDLKKKNRKSPFYRKIQ